MYIQITAPDDDSVDLDWNSSIYITVYSSNKLLYAASVENLMADIKIVSNFLYGFTTLL